MRFPSHGARSRPSFSALFFVLLLGCEGDAKSGGSGGVPGAGGAAEHESGGGGPTDITDVELSLRSTSCAGYVAEYTSSVLDVQRDLIFTGVLTIVVDGDTCVFTSNSIPNHDFNDTGARFANPVVEVTATYRVPAAPAAAASAQPLGLVYDNAIFLNGVKLDLLAAACYGVGNEPLGQERIGCFDAATPWRYDPMFPGNDFGTDSHNAHTQPDGTYHYHGDPHALFDETDPTRESPVIGYAADGFPIYGPYIDDSGTIRRVRSGYTLRAGTRQSQAGEGALPPGAYDGTYRDDYEFTDAGDLDECNGMTRDGSYGYYVTDSYPWVLGCFRGTPDSSFRKAM